MTDVSELTALKIENTVLKLQQLQAAAEKLVAEQAALVEQARTEVTASPEARYNVQTRRFED